MRADASPWDGNGWIVTVDDRPVGNTLSKEDATRVARWLNSGALEEIEAGAFVTACAKVANHIVEPGLTR